MFSKYITIIPAASLAFTHVSLHAIELKIQNKDGWHFLSVLSGISSSYIFLGLIPDLEKHRYVIAQNTDLDKFDRRFYALLMLFGFTIFYSLESWVKFHRKLKTKEEDDNPLSDFSPNVYELLPCEQKYIFFMHMIAFSAYDFVISFLIPVKFVSYGWKNMLFYFIAMQSHFIIDDMSLHEHFGTRYDSWGRIPLFISTVAGFLTALFWEPNSAIPSCMSSFIAGGTIINVMKEELPLKSKSAVPLFWTGGSIYAFCIIFFY